MLKKVSITSICILLLLQVVGGSLVLAASPVNHLNLNPRQHSQQEKINPQPQRIKEETEEINNLLIEEDWDMVAPELIDYEFVDWYAVSADALGIDDDALWEALESGQTLAEIAAAQGVDVQTISDAILAAEQALIDELVAAGDLSQEDADEWLADIKDEITYFIEDGWDMDSAPIDIGYVDWYAVSAAALAIEEDALWEALESGQTLAEIAAAQGVDVLSISDAILAAEQALIDELVAAGDLSQEDADEWLASLEEEIVYFIESGWGMEAWDDAEFVDWFAVSATALAIEEDALWEALESGQTLAEIAAAQGVDVQSISDAILAAERALIDKLVATSDLSQEDADEWLTSLEDEINSFIAEGWDPSNAPIDIRYVDWFAVSASTLGLEDDALWEALAAGQNLAEIAAAQGVDVQSISEAILAAEKALIDELVVDGEFTQEDADEWLASLEDEINSFIAEGWAMEEWGMDAEYVDWYAVSATALGIDEDALWKALESGQTLSEIAAAQGVDVQSINDAILAAEKALINELVVDGEFTQEDADEWLASLEDEINSFIAEGWAMEEWDEIDAAYMFEAPGFFDGCGEIDDEACFEIIEGDVDSID